MGIKVIKQYDEKDCGPACLAMIAQYYGKRVSIPKLREMAKTDKLGTNLYGLIQAGKQIGLSLTGVKADSIAELQSADLPIIVHIINQKGYDHYVIVEKIKNKTVYLVDPDKGKYKLSEDAFKQIWTNVAVLIQPMDTFTTKAASPPYMKIFLDIFKVNYKKLLLLMVMSIIINLVGIVGALYFKFLTDDIIPAHLSRSLFHISLAILILYIANAVISYLRYQLILKLSLNIDMRLMKDYFQHVLHLPATFFDTRKSGEILQRFMDTSKIREALSSSTVTLFVDTLMILIGGVLLFMQSPALLLVTFLFIPLFILCGYILRKPFEKYNQKVAENEADLSAYLIESFDGNQTIKSYESEQQIFQKGAQKFDGLIRQLLKLGQFSNIQLTLNNFLKLTITLVILWMGSYLVMTHQMTLGSLIAFNALTIYYLDPIERLINIQPTLQSSFVAARRIAEITDLDTEQALYPTQLDFQFKHELTFKNVYFQYGFRNTVLNDVSLSIKKGQKVAIVGESGSGKSTIGKLLNHYYETDDGDILLDGQPLNQIHVSQLRTKIGYVSQDTFLFGETILQNLLKGCNSHRTQEEVMEACRMAEVIDFVERLPQKFNTMLEKNGANLSGGQAQRIALARTFLKQPDIYIFDEATSALDSVTEHRILENIDTLVKHGKTVIIISHKLSTIQNSDVIYTLNKGRVVESGTHRNLMAQQGDYYHLWKMQQSDPS